MAGRVPAVPRTFLLKNEIRKKAMIDSTTQNQWTKLLPPILGAVVIIIGTANIFGWLFNSTVLMSVNASFVSMKPNTAVGLMLLGTSLFSARFMPNLRSFRFVVGALPLLAVALGALTLLEYILTIEFGIDELLFKDHLQAIETWSPGRMAGITCFSFIFSGLALHFKLSAYERLRQLPDILALGTCFAAIFVLLGYAYETESLRNLGMFGGMAIHTAVGFLLLAASTLLIRPNDGILGPLFAGRTVGVVMLWILPTVVLGPVAIGLLSQLGVEAGLFGHGEGIALEVVTTIFFLVVLTLFAAHAVNRADRKVKQAESIVRRFFDVSNDLLCIANMDGYFVKVNGSWEQTLGFTLEELTRRPFIEFVHPDDVEPTLNEYNRQAVGHDVISFENRYLCKDGSYRTLLWNATRPVDNGLIYASAHDITDRKLAEHQIAVLNNALSSRAQALEAANAELEAFSYSVSHDLRAPLRSIDGFSQALLEDYNGKLDEMGKDYLKRVRSSTQRMGQLIDDMLQLSRVTRSDFQREELDVSEIVRSIVKSLREKDPQRAVEIEIEDQLRANCDPRLARIALENLIQNAWKFTSRKEIANIRFGVYANSPVQVFMVSDNGVGFDATYVGKLFSPFQRLHRQEEFEGTGIGLATVKRIVTRHGGIVWAEGKINQGATFYFTLTPKNQQGENCVRENYSVGRGQSGRRPIDAPCT